MEVHFPSTSSNRRHRYHKSGAADCSVISYLTHRGMHGRSTSLLGSRLQAADTLYQKDLTAHYGCVNALEFSKCGQYFMSGGDDRRVLLWHVCHGVLSDGPTTSPPVAMHAKHNSNIFSLASTSTADKIFSAGNDQMVIVHDAKTGRTLDTYMHEAAVYCVTVSPDNDAIFATASEDGQLQLYDSRTSCDWEDNQLQVSQSHYAFHSVQFHPQQSALLLSANYKEGVALWDARNCTGPVLRYGGHRCLVSTMSATFNSIGDTVLALRRRHTPVLYHTRHTAAVAEFDAPHYYNSCTMKSCCFAGDRDQLVLSGSDDFSLYAWKVPELPQPGESPAIKITSPHLTLRGHRSIVNQVRYSGVTGLIASAGVGKTVKVWSSLPFPGVPLVTGESRITRRVYTHSQYIRLIMQAATHEPHDYTDGNTDEDPRMMAFFDSLVQREIDGYSFFSDDSLTQSSTETESTEDSVSEDDEAVGEKKNNQSLSPREPLPLIPAKVLQSLVSSDKTRKKLQVRRRGMAASERWRRATQRRNLRRRIGSYLSLSEVLELCSAVGLDVDNMLDIHRQEVENDDLRAAAAGDDTSDESSDDNRLASRDAIPEVSIPGWSSSPEPGIPSLEPDTASPELGSASCEAGTSSFEAGTSREPGSESRKPVTDSSDDSENDSAPSTSVSANRISRVKTIRPRDLPGAHRLNTDTSIVTESIENALNASSTVQGGSTSVIEPVNNFDVLLTRPGCSTSINEPMDDTFGPLLTRLRSSASVHDTVDDNFDPLLTIPSCSASILKPVDKMSKRGRVYLLSPDRSSSDTDASVATARRSAADFNSCGDSSSDSESPRDGSSCKRKMKRSKKNVAARKKAKRTRETYGLRGREWSALSQRAESVANTSQDVRAGSPGDGITTSTQQESNPAVTIAGNGCEEPLVGVDAATNVVTPEVLNSVTVVTSTQNVIQSGISQHTIDLPTSSTGFPQSSTGGSGGSSSSGGSNSSSSSNSSNKNSSSSAIADNVTTSTTATTSTTTTTTTTTLSAASSSRSPAAPSTANPPNNEPRPRYGVTRMPAWGRSNRRAVTSRISREAATHATIPVGHRDIADMPISPIRIRSRSNAPAPLGPAPRRRSLFPDEYNIATRANRVQEPSLLRAPGEVPSRALQCGGELYSYDLVLQLIACKRKQREQRRNLRRQDRRMRRYAARQARRIIEKESKRRAKNQQLFQERRKRRRQQYGDEGFADGNTNPEADTHSAPSCSSWYSPSTSAATGSSSAPQFHQQSLASATPTAGSSSGLQGYYSTSVGSDGRRSRRGQALAPYTLVDDSDDILNNQQSEEGSSGDDEDGENSRLRWLLQSSMRIRPQIKQSARRRSTPRSYVVSDGTQDGLTAEQGPSRGGLGYYVPIDFDSASTLSAAPASSTAESVPVSANPIIPVSPMLTSPSNTPGVSATPPMIESSIFNPVSASSSVISTASGSLTCTSANSTTSAVDGPIPTSSVSTRDPRVVS